jgi:hypothetical protein
METVIFRVVAPFDHKYVPPLADDDLKVTLPPAQKVVEPLMTEIVGADGKAFTVTDMDLAALVPQPLDALTVNVPEVALFE